MPCCFSQSSFVTMPCCFSQSSFVSSKLNSCSNACIHDCKLSTQILISVDASCIIRSLTVTRVIQLCVQELGCALISWQQFIVDVNNQLEINAISHHH